ncbi:ankyrin repeat domain-containing protein, partial [Singulisphaera rosea]
MTTDPSEEDFAFGKDSWWAEHAPRREVAQRVGDAIRSGDLDSLARILEEHPELAQDGLDIPNLLEDAASLGRAEAIDLLIRAGVSPDTINENGGTALMKAAWHGQNEVARVLLAAGADPDILLDDDGDPEMLGCCALH